MRARVPLLLALLAVLFVSACTNGPRLTEEEKDRRSEEILERLSD